MNNENQPEAPIGPAQMEPEAGRESSIEQAHAALASEANEATNQVEPAKEQSAVAAQSVSVSPFNKAFVQSFIDRCCKAVSKNRCAEIERIVSRVVPPEQASQLAAKAEMKEGTREAIVSSGTDVAEKWGLGNILTPEVMLITALGVDWMDWQDAKADMEAIVAKHAPKSEPAPKQAAPVAPVPAPVYSFTPAAIPIPHSPENNEPKCENETKN